MHFDGGFGLGNGHRSAVPGRDPPAEQDVRGNLTVGAFHEHADADGGVEPEEDAGTVVEGKRLVSELVEVTTHVPTFSASKPITEFAPDNAPSAAALDTARQVLLMQQESGIYAHETRSRGQRFAGHLVDPLGSDAHVAWQPSNQRLYACYTVGLGVRVRRSFDGGWFFWLR